MARSLDPEAAALGTIPAAVASQSAWDAPANAAAFAGVMHEHQAMVFSLAYHFLQNRATAEDVTQEVFLGLYQNLRAIQSPDHLKHWLRQVTSRRCIDLARKARLWRLLGLDEAPEPAAEFRAADPALSRRLQLLVASLPARPRMMVVLRYQEDLELTEIAAVLGVPLNTVKSSLRRALELLRRKLAEQSPRVTS
jgi:RNA polymerase sigma-70 factor (ECF subfamily)